jgi:release factor glutamine methyltransferase
MTRSEDFVGLTLAETRQALKRTLERGGIENAHLDSRLLLCHALSIDHSTLIARAENVLDSEAARMVAGVANQRLAHEPVSRIFGQREFWGLPFRLNFHTFAPRPETETVVEAVLAAFPDPTAREKVRRVADLGTGSGALLLALLSELPHACGVGTDIALPALACARANAMAQGVRASFIACDYGSALKPPFDLVVSNPPYIRTGDIAALAPDVCQFDPKAALDGGADGLDGYRAMAADAARLLAPDGVLVVELGCNQAKAVKCIFHDAGLAAEEPRSDLSGIPRALPARPRRGFRA